MRNIHFPARKVSAYLLLLIQHSASDLIWVGAGYTLDLKHINASSQHTNKKEFDLSLYSSMLGIDLFWRQTGNDYHVQRMNLSSELDTSPMHKVPFDGFKSSIKGFNL